MIADHRPVYYFKTFLEVWFQYIFVVEPEDMLNSFFGGINQAVQVQVIRTDVMLLGQHLFFHPFK